MRLAPILTILVFVAVATGGCTAKQASLKAKPDNKERAQVTKNPNAVPASIYQGYNVTGSRF